MGPNFMIMPIAALIPLAVGFIWYNPKIMGTAWMNETGMTEEKAKQSNMMVVFGLSYLFACLVTLPLMGIVNHQFGIFSLFADEPGFGEAGSETMRLFAMVNDTLNIGSKHLTFGHGAVHGGIAGIGLALPIIATNAMFEQKSWKYIWINVGYWTVSLILMGGVLCQWGWNVG